MSLDGTELPPKLRLTALCFNFNKIEQFKTWWVVIYDDEMGFCTENPGKDVDLYIYVKRVVVINPSLFRLFLIR